MMAILKVRTLITMDEKLLNEVKQACPEGVELARFLGIMVRLGYFAKKGYGKRHHEEMKIRSSKCLSKRLYI
jgi:hypothetical protein